MPFTREMIEAQIHAQTTPDRPRPQVIAKKIRDAKKGARKAENAVWLGQMALQDVYAELAATNDAFTIRKLQQQAEHLTVIIAQEGRYCSLENQIIAIIEQIMESEPQG